MLEAKNLHKNYGHKIAVQNISFAVPDGRVTGFLGPNGAGKSTTMRMFVGLETPTSGQALVENQLYTKLHAPLCSVGALLDAKIAHPRRSGINHLRALAATHGFSNTRVMEVLELTGLKEVGKNKFKTYSLGMAQRLGIAAALLGDPQNLILDEPINGLDPEGVKWVRELVKYLAAEGKSVLISSHLMSEIAQTANELVIIGKGKLLTNTRVEDFLRAADIRKVFARTDEQSRFAALLGTSGYNYALHETDGLIIEKASTQEIAHLAFRECILIYELTQQTGSLEEAYMQLVAGEVAYAMGDYKNGAAAKDESAHADPNDLKTSTVDDSAGVA